MKTIIKIFTAAIVSILSTQYSGAQQSLTIQQCYQLAEENYPLAKQKELIAKTAQYSVDNISKGIFPQFIVSGAATYQNAVTEFDLSGLPVQVDVPKPSKDQYRIQGEIVQSLTDFPLVETQRKLKSAEAEIQQQNVEVELYKLRDRINQLFFGALLIDEQLKQSDLFKSDLDRGIKQTQAAIDNGTAFKSSLSKLQAERLKANQRDIELKAARKSYTDMLGLFIGRNIDTSTILIKPAPPVITDSIRRPELQVFELQRKASQLYDKLIARKNIPKLNIFFQGGAGMPSPVNFLAEDFSPFYITGLRLYWSLGGMYTLKKEKLITANDRKVIDVMQNTFLFNTNLSVKQQDDDIAKYEALIEADKEIISLRESVKKTSVVQLENGVITTNDYLKEVTEEDQARQNLILHNLQLLMVQYAQKITKGN